MASARRVGTNEQIQDYAGGAADYATGEWPNWEGDTDTDHVADTETDVIECFRGNHSDAALLQGAALDNDADYHRIMRPASGEGNHGGVCRVSVNYASFTSANQFHGLRLSEQYSQIQDLVGASSHAGFNGGVFKFQADAAFAAFVGCLVDGRSGDGVTENGFFSFNRTDSDEAFIIDCAVQNADNHGLVVSSGIVNAYNTTIEGSDGVGFTVGGGATLNAKNGLSDNTGNDYGGAGTLNQTACSSADATGSAGLQSQTYSFVDSANGDLHITVASDGDDDGTDLSADADYAFSTDIDDVEIINWPCGYNDPTAAVAGIPIFRRRIEGD